MNRSMEHGSNHGWKGAPSPDSSPAPRKRILVVEDHTDVAEMIAHALSDRYEVVLTSDGTEALELVEKGPAPDLIISDVMMPELDGVTMLKRLRKQPALRMTPVIFLTARSAPRDIIAGIQAGARQYLVKPIDLEELKRRVRSILKSW